MQYLVQMKLADSGRSTSPQEGVSFIEQFVLPTLELCRSCKRRRKSSQEGLWAGRSRSH